MVLSNQSKGFLFALLSALFWGTNGSFIKILSELGFRDITLVALQPTVLALFFLISLLVSHPSALLINWKFLLIMMVHGGVLLGGAIYCDVKAITLVPVGIVSIISFCHIILLMLVTRMVFGYKITKEKTGAALIALIGISLTLEIYHLGSSTLNWQGIIWAAIIPLEMSVAYTLIKFYLLRGIDYKTYIFYVNLFASLVFWYTAPPWKVAGETLALAAVHGPYFWLILFGFILIPLVGSYVLFAKAYQLIEPTYVSLMYSLDPITATLLGYFILHQSLSGMQLVGMLITLIPVAYIQYHEGKQNDITSIKGEKPDPGYSHIS
jgi:DME family drug/metabolite transporter